jgi:nitrite reductase/ring-hydroxylating ferredoxin subunit
MSEWREVARADDVPEGGTLLVDLGSEPVCLYNIAGRIYATHDTCTHGQASLSDGFIADDQLIECPLHQGTFDIRTGRAVGPPCTVDIKAYAVKVEDGKVYLRD